MLKKIKIILASKIVIIAIYFIPVLIMLFLTIIFAYVKNIEYKNQYYDVNKRFNIYLILFIFMLIFALLLIINLSVWKSLYLSIKLKDEFTLSYWTKSKFFNFFVKFDPFFLVIKKEYNEYVSEI